MKKNLKIIIILLVIIAVGVGAIVFINLDNSNEPPIIVNPSGDSNSGDIGLAFKVVVRDVPILIKTDNRYIDCVYPSITSLKNKEFENYINNEISQNIQAYRNEIEFMVDEETLDTALYSYITSYDRYNSR